jgi:peptide/nickel transport system ATP-binding protein
MSAGGPPQGARPLGGAARSAVRGEHTSATDPALVEFDGVSVVFDGRVRALDDVTLAIRKGEIVGLVGESGSGKSTLCRVLVGLTRPSSGMVRVGGQSVARHLEQEPLAFRRRAQMLLQDAVASLSPRMTIGRALEEPIAIHNLPRTETLGALAAILQRLGLPQEVLTKFPHQISGGQARRVGVARALLMRPEIVVADEPTAGLDVSVQGELLNLLLDLQQEFGLTYLVVSHNLNVVRRITRRTVVMYLGQIVDEGATRDLFAAPAHPYTAALLSTNPAVDPRKRYQPIVLQGEIPSAVNPPSGCRFHTRCPVAQPRCATEPPILRELDAGRRVRCHFPFSLERRRH